MKPRLLRALLLTYPPSLRHSYGSEMAEAVEQQWRARRSFMSRLKLAGELASDAAASWRSRRRPSFPKMRNTSSDFGDAFRLFRRSPLFGLGAVLTLALGIGATTAILTLADAALFHPLPIARADRLVQATFSWSYPDFRDLAAGSRTMSTVAAWSNQQFAVERASETTQVVSAAVSGSYFSLAGQRAIAGRLINSGDDVPGAPVVAVISERLWTRVFHRDPSLIGAVVNVNRRPVTVIGAVSSSFRGLSLQNAPEFFIPVATLPDVSTGFLADPKLLSNRGRVWLTVAGRLQDGVAAVTVDQEARQIYNSHRAQASNDATEWFSPLLPQAMGVRTVADLQRFMTILIGASALTLLLTCATVANLLLVRAERRRHELAIRAALGAGRGRIARLLLVESLGIGLAGAAAGVGVAMLTLQLLGTHALPGGISIDDLHLSLSPQRLLVGAVLGLVTAVVFGVGPAFSTARRSGTAMLRAGARGVSRQPVRSMLVTVQIALCVLLLGGSIAFGRALQHALSFDFGFNVAETSMTAINPSLARYTPAQSASIHRDALERVRALPSVNHAAWAMLRPLSGALTIEPKLVGSDLPAGAPDSVLANVVTDGYFETLGIPIISGRALTAGDLQSAEGALVVSESLARLYWPGQDAIGKRMRLIDRDDAGSPGAMVVGIAADIHRAVGGPGVPMLYVPSNQVPPGFSADYLFVRCRQNPATLLPEIRTMLHTIDPNVPITTSATMAAHVAGPLMAHRLGLTLFLMFAGLAVILTTFGLYAIVATAISQRTREIGIRVALGAEASRVVMMVWRQGLLPIVAGIAAGLVAFALSARLIKSFMFSLTPVNAGTLVVLACAIAVVAVAAMLLPVRRALSVDPAITLRSE
jgi:putative ABC transport system permease protein